MKYSLSLQVEQENIDQEKLGMLIADIELAFEEYFPGYLSQSSVTVIDKIILVDMRGDL